MSFHGPRLFRGSVLPTGILVLLLLLGMACGGGGGDDISEEDDDDPTATPPAADEEDPTPGAFEETISVNGGAWYGGFLIELGDATFVGTAPDALGRQEFSVSIEATFNNLGEEQRRFLPTIALVTPEGALQLAFGSEVPQVPGGLSSSGTLVFRVPPDFEFDGAYVLIGEGGKNRGQIPLGEGAGELVAWEPSEPPLAGTISMDLIDLEFTSAALRADDPINYAQLDEGELALTLTFEATSHRPGNWAIFALDFVLLLPDGNAAAVVGSNVGSLPGSADGVTTPDLYVRFVVDQPAAGTYTLVFTPTATWVEDGATEGELEFEIE